VLAALHHCCGESSGLPKHEELHIMAKSLHTFRVDFGSVKLTAAQQKRVAEAIERTVAAELPSLDLGPAVTLGRVRKEWIGIWIDRFRRGAVNVNMPVELQHR
jgi:hypothetical protein